MKHSILHTSKLPELPFAWREAESAVLQAIAADTCDDRVSEDIFDAEDEYAEVDMIVRRMSRDAS